MKRYDAEAVTGYRFVVHGVLWVIYLAVIAGLIYWWVRT